MPDSAYPERETMPFPDLIAKLKRDTENYDFKPSDAAVLLMESPDTVKALAEYFTSKNIPAVSFYDQGGQSILFMPPDGDVVFRVGNRRIEGHGTGVKSDKKIKPLDEVELGDGFVLKVFAYLPEKGSNRHVNVLREELAQESLDFSDAKPDNVRLLPDDKKTPVVTDDGAVEQGAGAQFVQYMGSVRGRKSEYEWKGLQERLFEDVSRKYNLPGVKATEQRKSLETIVPPEVLDARPVEDEDAPSRKPNKKPWKDRDAGQKNRRGGAYDDDGDDEGFGGRGGRGGGRRNRY